MKKNWKTTAAGILGGLLMIVGPRLSGDKSAAPVTFGNTAPAIAMAVLGMAAKDGSSK